jgi:hypothetical protein
MMLVPRDSWIAAHKPGRCAFLKRKAKTMNEKYLICTRGFKNFVENGKATGFQLDVRITYYRGVPLSCVEGFDIKVDGESFGPEKLRYLVNGRLYTAEQAAEETKARFQYYAPMTLVLSKPGGLTPGVHDVEVTEKLRISYHNDEINPSIATARKKLALVM